MPNPFLLEFHDFDFNEFVRSLRKEAPPDLD